MGSKDIGQVAQDLAKNMEEMQLENPEDDEDSEIDDAPIFTPELARLKAREAGKELPADEGDEKEDADDDDDMEADDNDGNAD